MGKYLIATTELSKGTSVMSFSGPILQAPTMHTIQMGVAQHLDVNNDLQYAAHSCAPNCTISFLLMSDQSGVISLNTIDNIQIGDILSWDYRTTEWDMQSPFECCCGSPNCGKRIQGMKYLSQCERLEFAEELLSPFMKTRMLKVGGTGFKDVETSISNEM